MKTTIELPDELLLGVSGARVFDLQIALTGFDNGATEVWSRRGPWVPSAQVQ